MTDAQRSTLDATRPAPTPARPYNFPAFVRRTLPNGLTLVVAPVHKLPVVTALAVIDAGAAHDPAGQEGVAQLTAMALEEGTERLDAIELADRFERVGTTLDAGADWDSAIVQLTALTPRFADAFALMGEVILSPRFPDREIERLKAERLSDLLQLRTEPRGLADEMFAKFAYAEQSRFGRPEGGSEHSVPTLTRDAVERFHRARYVPKATTIVIAGDVTVEDAERLATEVFGAWEGDTPAGASVDDSRRFSDRRVHVVTKSDAPQSEIRLGHVGVPRSHPDYFSLVIMNAVLGGLFSSRINLNLREAHAYTYGAHSGFSWRRSASPFDISTAVQSDVTDAAVRETLFEIDRMRTEQIAPEELSLATSYLDGVFPIRYESTGAIAGALASMVIFELGDDYFQRYRDRITSVTAEQVLDVAQRHLDPDALQIVVVGDPEAIRAPLEALGAGPVQVYDAEGRPV